MSDEEFLGEDDTVLEDLVSDLEKTAGSASFFEDSFSLELAQHHSTPVSTPQKGGSSKALEQKKRISCPECDNTYANERTLGVHVKMHRMRAVSLRAPTEEDLLPVMNSLFSEALKEMLDEERKTGVSDGLKNYVMMLEESHESKRTSFLKFVLGKFLESVNSQNSLLPSALYSTMLVKFNQFLNNEDFYQACSKLLVDIYSTDFDTLNLFLGTMLLKVFNKILAVYLRKLRGGEDRDSEIFKRSSDKIDSIHFQQTVYYISGFILNSILLKAHSDTPSRSWSVYIDVLNRIFLSNPGSECSAQVSLFTKQKDRGGLKHCSSKAFDFFLVLFDFLGTLENSHGSPSLALVDEEVTKHDVLLLLWDELVGTFLTEQQSLDLLILITDSCTRTTNRGIMKRRLNEHFTKNVSQIAFRARLSR